MSNDKRNYDDDLYNMINGSIEKSKVYNKVMPVLHNRKTRSVLFCVAIIAIPTVVLLGYKVFVGG